jgi:hypothetical protein
MSDNVAVYPGAFFDPVAVAPPQNDYGAAASAASLA